MTSLFNRFKRHGDDDIEYKENNIVEIINDDENFSSDSEIDLNKNAAPLEKTNPLGYNINAFSVVVLVLHGVVGTGIFSTPGTILKSMGSIGGSYVIWLTTFYISLFNAFVYIEYANYFFNRNGGDVAYLEQAFPFPKFLVPTTFAAVNVVLSFTTSSALAFGKYILLAADVEVGTWNYRGVSIAALTAAALLVSVNTKWSLRLQNVLGYIKIVHLLFMVILGWVILSGKTKVKNPRQNFHNVWEGTTTSGNNIATSIINTTFSYGGYSYAFGVVAEHHRKRGGADSSHIQSFKRYVPLSMFVLYILYILIITSYFAAASVSEIKSSSNSVASLLFENAFETKSATKALDVLVALSAFGHLITAIVSHSRSLRECGRQGVLPFPKFWSQTKPFGTPIGPVFITWLVNFIMVVGPPAGSAFNFIIDLGSYQGYIFSFALITGLFKLRRARKNAGIDDSKNFKVPTIALVVTMLFQLMVIAMAFVPPSNGTLIGSDVTFFYATYPLVCIGLLLACILYYVIWRFVLPRIGNFTHRELIYKLENNELGKKVVKVKNADLQSWDAAHNTNQYGVGEENPSSITTVTEDDTGIDHAASSGESTEKKV